MDVKTFELAGSRADFVGDAADPYFVNLDGHAAHIAPIARLAEREVGDGEIILDVGANIGLSALTLARACPRARIIAFEPSPRHADFLRRNLAANGAGHVEVIQAAVSARSGGELRFHVAAYGAGSHVVTNEHLGAQQMETIGVPMFSIDDVIGDRRRVAFIKMDVEGHEPEAIRGASTVLHRDRPLMFVEYNAWCLDAFGGHSPAAVAKALWGAFEPFRVESDGALSPASDPISFLHETLASRGAVNDIALRPRDVPFSDAWTPPREQIEELRRQVEALHNSTSWKVTAPLRWLRKLISVG